MTFDELLAQANKTQKKFLPKDKAEPISERTLRYWIAKGVLEKRTTRGPNTSYPEAFVWRIVLTRQHQLSYSMTLDEIAEVQASTADVDVKGAVEALVRLRATGSVQKTIKTKTSKSVTKTSTKKPSVATPPLRPDLRENMGFLQRGLSDIDEKLERQSKYQALQQEQLMTQMFDRVESFASHIDGYADQMLHSNEMLISSVRDLAQLIERLRDDVESLDHRLARIEGDK